MSTAEEEFQTEEQSLEDEIQALYQVSLEVAAPSEDELPEAVTAEEFHPDSSMLHPPSPFSLYWLENVQSEHLKWQTYNFGPPKTEEQFMGMTEELGELAHALLKRSQEIRGTRAEHDAAAKDAIGDLLIFTMALCNAEGWSLQRILEDTWQEVRSRNWKRFPKDGRTE